MMKKGLLLLGMIMSVVSFSFGQQAQDINELVKGRLQKAAVREFLANPENIHARTEDSNRTLLHWAAYYGKVDIVRQILEYNPGIVKRILGYKYRAAYVDAIDESGKTPLMLAVRSYFSYKALAIVVMLLNKNANINAVDQDGNTVLMHAVKALDGSEVVDLLLARGAIIRDQDRPRILFWAVENFRNRWALQMLNQGVPIDTKDKNGNTALHLAALYGNTLFIAELIRRRANQTLLNNDDKSALDLAIEHGHTAIIEALLPTNINAKDCRGNTVLHKALNVVFRCSNPFFRPVGIANVQMLVDKGADVHVRDKDNNTPLYLALRAVKTGHTTWFLRDCRAMMAILLVKGADSKGLINRITPAQFLENYYNSIVWYSPYRLLKSTITELIELLKGLRSQSQAEQVQQTELEQCWNEFPQAKAIMKLGDDKAAYRAIFGLQEKFSQEDLRKSYRKLLLKWHPDKHLDDNRLYAAEVAKLVGNARDALQE